MSQGTRLRPGRHHPVTPGLGPAPAGPRETEIAVYAFGPDVDLEPDLVVVYGLVESAQWQAILPRVQAERARVRARGRDGPRSGTCSRGSVRARTS